MAEGLNAAVIRPLIFPVSVQSRVTRCGAPDALDRLVAVGYLTVQGRRSHATGRRGQLERRLHKTGSDLDSVKAALLTLFCALPVGALNMSDGDGDDGLAEASGWGDVLETHWCSAAEDAATPTELMECVLLLEAYLSKAWYLSNTNALVNAMPSPHFAIRCCTLAAVALRIYMLDRILDYSKVVQETRKGRNALHVAPKKDGRGATIVRVEKTDTAPERVSGRVRKADEQQQHGAIKNVGGGSYENGGAGAGEAAVGDSGSFGAKRARPSYAVYAEESEEED